MSENKTAILVVSEAGLPVARLYQRELGDAVIYATSEWDGCERIASHKDFLEVHFAELARVIFIGALGICVRSIAGCIKDKYHDPAVVCVDSTGRQVIPVISGHVGGANDLARQLAAISGGEAIITTQSDNQSLWPLDTLARQWGWRMEETPASMNQKIFAFVNGKPTALLLEIRDAGTDYLERTLPAHVRIFYHFDEIPLADFELLIAVTPWIHESTVPTLYYRPAVLNLGIGCRKACDPEGISEEIDRTLLGRGLSPLSIRRILTIELKQEELLLADLLARHPGAERVIYKKEDLEGIQVPNPSEKAFAATGLYGVAEACCLRAAEGGDLLIEKQKGCLKEGAHFTFALSIDGIAERKGHIEIVGAGPGDPELVSVRGKRFLERADLILYAGSLVPRELTFYAKKGAVVRNSASLTLEEQFELMKSFYDKGLLVVRLHTGDPCIYGAIQEQMAFFDRYGMSYHITPGISSFQAAAAALRSQFTIPEKVQTIILTRGEGRTPMPEREQLHKLAQSRSTMCIYLSAALVEQVQAELLQAYPPETPVAACYKLTWKEEKIYRGELKDLAKLVRENNLTLTTLLVVGDAIDNRQGLSRLYSHEFKHLFRP